jgi:hypothetical protein
MPNALPVVLPARLNVLVTVFPICVPHAAVLKTPIPTELVATVVLAVTSAVIHTCEFILEGVMLAVVSDAMEVVSTLVTVVLAITVNPVLPHERFPLPSVTSDWPGVPVALGKVNVRFFSVLVLP